MGSAFPDIDVVGVFPAGQGGGATTCGVPESADAVMVNVVAVNMEGGSGHLSVGTGGADPVDEATTPFAVLTPKMNNGATTIINLGPGGTVAIDVDGDTAASTMIRVEVLGYYDNDVAGLDFYDLAPCAVFDTRTNQGATGSFAGERLHGPANTTTYQIAGNSVPVGQGGVVDTGGGTGTCGVPDDAEAVLINLEAVNASTGGQLLGIRGRYDNNGWGAQLQQRGSQDEQRQRCCCPISTATVSSHSRSTPATSPQSAPPSPTPEASSSATTTENGLSSCSSRKPPGTTSPVDHS